MKVLIVVTYTKELEVEVPDTDLEDRRSEAYKQMVAQLADKADEMTADEGVPLHWVSTSFLSKENDTWEEFEDVS